MRHVLICLVVLAATYFHTAEAREETNEGRVNTLQRTLLSPTLYPYARCLDGSPSGYYINRGEPTRWVVFLQGGGLCFTKKSCEGIHNTVSPFVSVSLALLARFDSQGALRMTWARHTTGL